MIMRNDHCSIYFEKNVFSGENDSIYPAEPHSVGGVSSGGLRSVRLRPADPVEEEDRPFAVLSLIRAAKQCDARDDS